MTELKVVVSNKTYGEEWLDDIKESNPAQYAVIHAIIEVIKENEGVPLLYFLVRRTVKRDKQPGSSAARRHNYGMQRTRRGESLMKVEWARH